MKKSIFLFLFSFLSICCSQMLTAQITGNPNICIGSTSALVDISHSGLWTSGNTAVATVGSGSGLVTGVSVGTALISFNLTGGAVDVFTINVSIPVTTGLTTVCQGGTTILTNSTPGGLWGSNNPAVATINCNLGVLKGIAPGTAIMTYLLGAGCLSTNTVTVIDLTPNTGIPGVCAGSTTTLANAITGGEWISSNPSVATVGSSTGVVSGVVPGNTTITYTFGPGCLNTTEVTVITLGPNTGQDSICVGLSTTLHNVTLSGMWSSSNPSIASVASLTGIVNGEAPGVATITYSFGLTCHSTTVVTVNPVPTTVTVSGGGTFCNSATLTASGGSGGTIYFQGTTDNGTSTAIPASSMTVTVSGTYFFRSMSSSGCWGAQGYVNVVIQKIIGPNTNCLGMNTILVVSGGAGIYGSSNPSIATVGAGTGVVVGVSAGTVMITNTTPLGCLVSQSITVLPSPPTISGPSSVCLGQTVTLTNPGAGGTWSSSAPTIASVVATSGVVSGIASGYGTSTITYTLGGSCRSFFTISVNPLEPISVIGTNSVCVGQNLTLSDAVSGGTWSTPTSTYATINASTGVVSGISPGSSTVSYVAPGGCIATTSVTVRILSIITGPSTVCQGQKITLSDSTGGGQWFSRSPTIASIDVTSGIIQGVEGGFDVTISYTLGTGCQNTTTVYVNPLLPIYGLSTVCQGLTISMTDSVLGGSWVSNAPGVASINSSGVITGVSSGIASITYTTPAGCYTTASVVVNPVQPITGPSTVCLGRSMLVSDSILQGTWSSSGTTVATVGSSNGIVTGIAGGQTATLTYTFCSGCKTTHVVYVNPLAVITGPASVCQGQTATLLNVNPGGTWTCGTSLLADFTVPSSGVISGLSPGTALVSYILPTGCTETYTITVNPLSVITGPSTVCLGQTITLSDATPGGTWSSGTPATASVGATTGIVTGVAGGLATTITYAMGTGCKSTYSVTVNPLAAITGPTSVCQGQIITLADATAGGTWSSSSPNVSVVSSTGVIGGITNGTAIVSYILPTGCTKTTTLVINPLAVITGPSSVCAGQSITLSDAIPSGTWTSSSPSNATAGASTGIITGVSGGSVNVTYTTTLGCKATAPITVNARALILGATSVCQSQNITLTNSVSGGTWSADGSGNASVGVPTTGIITGVNAGTAMISYILTTGCTSTYVLTVNPLSAITGPGSVCKGQSITLSDGTTGGTWSSSSPSSATVGASTGIVTGVAGSSTATITYTTPKGCKTTTPIIINPLDPITGPTSVCQGQSVTLGDIDGGGTWSSASGDVVISTGGVVTGSIAGTATITYTLATGCTITMVTTINPLTAITGSATVCQGQTTTLSDATTGGSWTSSSSTTASVVSGTGVVTGVLGGGTATITYTTPKGCKITAGILVNPISPITGPTSVCQGQSVTLADVVTGGNWSADGSGNASVAVPTTGIVSGVNTGTAMISYMLSTGCTVTYVMTINPLSVITGASSVCVGQSITLSDATTGGTWTSASPSNATAGATTGVITGVSASSSVNITYTTTKGCKATYSELVNPLAVVVGPSSVCQGQTITLTDAVSGGTWSPDGSGNASVGIPTTGIVTGVNPGTAIISYQLSTGCVATVRLTVYPLSAITGTGNVCPGHTITLSDATTGGSYSSGSLTTATVVSTTGVVTGVSGGTSGLNATITYTLGTGCKATTIVTVNPAVVVSAITGSAAVSISGGTVTLSDATSGGAWTSSNTAKATVGGLTGIVTGVSTGAVTITYTVTNAAGCSAYVTKNMTVGANPPPHAESGGTVTINTGSMIVLDNNTPAGTWSSEDGDGIINVDAETGLINGLAPGRATVNYVVNTNSGNMVTVTKIIVSAPGNLGTVDFINASDITLLPNPNKGDFTIKGTTGLQDETVTIEVTDMLGHTLYTNKAAVKDGTINEHVILNNLSSGSYLLNLHSAEGSKVLHFVIE